MQLTRCTQGLCLICALLVFCALILDTMAIFFTAGALAAGILLEYFVFDHRLRQVLSSLHIGRALSRNPVRKGTALQVTSTISIGDTSRLQVNVLDCHPPNTVIAEGDPELKIPPASTDRSFRCTYRLVSLVHGTQQFAGMEVSVRNLFFRTTIPMSRQEDCLPALTVLPTGYFAAPASDVGDGTRDNRKASIWSGVDVHSLREYVPGDDLRHADWKISAKYDKIFIRKFTAPMNYPPLVIVDLPWNGVPCPEKEFLHMMSEVTGLVKHTVQTFQYVSILMISGPNIVHMIREERNLARCIAELREWSNPQERPVHFYRMPDRSDLRALARGVESAGEDALHPAARQFLETLRDRYTRVLLYQRNPAFAGQVARALAQLLMTEAYVFSLGRGDTSHIRHVVRPLRTQKIRVNVRIINTPGKDTGEVSGLSGAVPEVRT